VGFANPELFPWTLSNAPCGWLARRFDIRGPNVTCTGEVEAILAALSQLGEHVETGQIDTAWLVAIDFAETLRQQTMFAAVRLFSECQDSAVSDAGAPHVITLRPGLPSTVLSEVLREIGTGRQLMLTDGCSRVVIESSRTSTSV
jgi:3-oxoacyl-(acyl-carrier-protein) synthase